MAKKLKHIQEVVDTATGEVKTLTKTFSVKSKSTEEFYLTFLSGLNAIVELGRPSDIKVLALLCAKAEFNTGIVRISTEDREIIMGKLGCSTSSFSNSLTRLKEVGLLSGSRGNFEINPHCFWKGTTDERNRLLRDKQMDLHLKFKMYGNADS